MSKSTKELSQIEDGIQSLKRQELLKCNDLQNASIVSSRSSLVGDDKTAVENSTLQSAGVAKLGETKVILQEFGKTKETGSEFFKYLANNESLSKLEVKDAAKIIEVLQRRAELSSKQVVNQLGKERRSIDLNTSSDKLKTELTGNVSPPDDLNKSFSMPQKEIKTEEHLQTEDIILSLLHEIQSLKAENEALSSEVTSLKTNIKHGVAKALPDLAIFYSAENLKENEGFTEEAILDLYAENRKHVFDLFNVFVSDFNAIKKNVFKKVKKFEGHKHEAAAHFNKYWKKWADKGLIYQGLLMNVRNKIGLDNRLYNGLKKSVSDGKIESANKLEDILPTYSSLLAREASMFTFDTLTMAHSYYEQRRKK